jgi:uncharacterized phage-associated protein
MPTVCDVAAYILKKRGPMTAMKLQKLVYYSQAWSLVWDSQPIFSEPIKAWANGPVVPALYGVHKGKFNVLPGEIDGDPECLSPESTQTVDAVLAYYGDRTPHYLSQLTHQESPWKNAREGLEPGERGEKEITHAEMAEYYAGLQ